MGVHPHTTEQFLTALLNHNDLRGQLPSMGTPVKDERHARDTGAATSVLSVRPMKAG